MDIKIKAIESPEDIIQVEEIQRQVWAGSETEVVPAHMLIGIVQHGGILIGAYVEDVHSEKCVGFVFGFPGMYYTPDGPRPMHCSHMLAVLPEYRDAGLGYKLKRAQWQMVRHQGLDRIVWTYDPLMSRNAYLNITKLGAVCNTYLRNVYGDMRDEINLGLESDRFEVDWWVDTNRVNRRLSRRVRRPLTLEHYLKADVQIINPSQFNSEGLPCPTGILSHIIDNIKNEASKEQPPVMFLVEVPSDFDALKNADKNLAIEWRDHTRQIFETLFESDYLVTDFVHSPGSESHSYYVLSYGMSTL